YNSCCSLFRKISINFRNWGRVFDCGQGGVYVRAEIDEVWGFLESQGQGICGFQCSFVRFPRFGDAPGCEQNISTEGQPTLFARRAFNDCVETGQGGFIIFQLKIEFQCVSLEWENRSELDDTLIQTAQGLIGLSVGNLNMGQFQEEVGARLADETNPTLKISDGSFALIQGSQNA